MMVVATNDESLETKLALQDVVLEVRVLASLRVVCLVVRAHDCASAGADGVGKGPEVQLVQSLVIDVGADGIDKALVLEVAGLAEVLLLVEDEVLAASNDTGVLDTTHCLSGGMTSQVRIGGKALPVALHIDQLNSISKSWRTYAALGVAAERAQSRTKLNINTL
jgi:hypothetical protein